MLDGMLEQDRAPVGRGQTVRQLVCDFQHSVTPLSAPRAAPRGWRVRSGGGTFEPRLLIRPGRPIHPSLERAGRAVWLAPGVARGGALAAPRRRVLRAFGIGCLLNECLRARRASVRKLLLFLDRE
jgi:hypothetical protein